MAPNLLMEEESRHDYNCDNDYVYMRKNNAIISNNQSKDLIAL